MARRIPVSKRTFVENLCIADAVVKTEVKKQKSHAEPFLRLGGPEESGEGCPKEAVTRGSLPLDTQKKDALKKDAQKWARGIRRRRPEESRRIRKSGPEESRRIQRRRPGPEESRKMDAQRKNALTEKDTSGCSVDDSFGVTEFLMHAHPEF